MVKYKHLSIGELCTIVKGETGLASATPGDYPLVTTSAERKTCITYQFDRDAVCIPLVSSTGHGKKTLNYVHFQSGKFALGTILAAVIPKEPKKLSAAFLHRYLQFFKDKKIVPLMKGAANVSLAVKDIAKIEVPIPPIDEQLSFIELFNRLNSSSIDLQKEFSLQSSYLSLLRQSILQEAIEGKLNENWRKNNPVRKGDPETDASTLFEKIKAEKQKLIEEGKVRKEKPLAPIKAEEVPFELPEGWVWCRLGEMLEGTFYGPRFGKDEYKKRGIPTIRTTAMSNGRIILKDPPMVDVSDKSKIDLYKLLVGDILITRTGTFGEYAVFNGNYLAFPSAYLISLSFIKLVFNKLFFDANIKSINSRALRTKYTKRHKTKY